MNPSQAALAATRRVLRVGGRWIVGFRGPWSVRDLTLLVLCPVLLVATAVTSERVHLDGHVMPGVALEGELVAGYSRDALQKRVAALQNELSQRVVRLDVDGVTLPVSAFEFDAALDQAALVDDILQQGRRGSWFEQLAWRVRRLGAPLQVSAQVHLDERRVQDVLAGFERALLVEPREAKLEFRDGALRRTEPRPGQVIDSQRAIEQIRQALQNGDAEPVAVALSQVQPATTNAELARVETAAKQMLLAPIAVTVEVPERLLPPGEADADGHSQAASTTSAVQILEPERLGRALYTSADPEDPARLQLGLDHTVLEELLAKVRERFERPALDAKFVVDNRGKISIVPGRVQTRLDTESAARALLAAGQSSSRRATVQITEGDAPRISTELAQTLNVRGLVSQFTTSHPCCRPRVQNIHRIADLLDGVVVLPGETFSVNEHVGPRGPRRGFVAAPTIVHGEMSDTYGGGISQFATTLFNAVLLGGYEIIERQAHSYYFSRYPLGHEATLSFPKPDLIFRNDTASGLLIKTEYGSTYIRVKLYGDNEGRVVRTETSQRFDLVDPKLEYEVDDSLQPEEAKVRKRGSKGFSVEVSRTIKTRDGKSDTERRKVVYNPRVRVVAVHSCKIPEGEPGHTGDECPEPELADAGVPPTP